MAVRGDAERQNMVAAQLAARGIVDARVLAAMATVERERFVGAAMRSHAYDDEPLDIGLGQTISQPYMVAKMAELCALFGDERVLEVGGGSGYAAAVLATLARHVTTIELREPLAANARRSLADHGIGNVEVVVGDGTLSWPANEPYDAIVVSAGAPAIPAPLVASLAPGGRLVIPVGDRHQQDLLVVRRDRQEGAITVERELACRFVALQGRYGW